MQKMDSESFDLATSILESTNDLTLATLRADGSPHASTLSFASDGLVIYAAIAIDSHKAHDIGHDHRVALTVNAPYGNWSEIQGLSIDAHAELIRDPAELAVAGGLLLQKLPAYANIIAQPHVYPWPGMVFLRIMPQHLTLLDYTKGFGHMETFDLRK